MQAWHICSKHGAITKINYTLGGYRLTKNSKLHEVYKTILAQFRHNNQDRCPLDVYTVDPNSNCFQLQQPHYLAPDLHF